MAKHIDFKNSYRSRLLVVRLYIFAGIGLTPSNKDGLADSFVAIRVGDGKGSNKHDSTRGNVIVDSLDPDYYVSMELKATIPGDSEVMRTCR